LKPAVGCVSGSAVRLSSVARDEGKADVQLGLALVFPDPSAAQCQDLFDKVESQVAKVVYPQVWSSRVQKLRHERGMSPVKNEIPQRSFHP
jgi:hypothetical protein